MKTLAPRAKVFIIVSRTSRRSTAVARKRCPGPKRDLKSFRGAIEKKGNASLKAEAKANGAIFVETFKASEGHDLCQAVGTRWIEPLIGSLTGVPVLNALGEQNDAFDVELAMLSHGVR